jgi:hypothetical protein
MDYYKIRELAYPYNYVVSIASILLSIAGAILGTLVLRIILRNKWKLLSIDLKLICFTLIFDLLMSFYCFISGICNIVGYSGYLNSKFSCTLNAIIYIFTCVTSINLVGVVALERYLLIVKEIVLHNRTYYIIILSLQFLNLASCLITSIFGSFGISSTSVYCIYDTANWAGISGTMILALSISISIIMTYFSYTNIIIKRRKLTLQNQTVLPFKAKKIRRDANSTIIKSALIIIASTITNLPFNLFLIMEFIDPKFLTPQIQTICTILSMFNMVINSLIILRLRTDLWNKFKEAIFIKSDNSSDSGINIDDYQLTTIELDTNDK